MGSIDNPASHYFWKRWRQYLYSFQSRWKLMEPKENIKVDTVFFFKGSGTVGHK